MRKKLQTLVAEYGVVALVIWLVIFALCWAGFAVAILLGIQVEGAAGTAGVALGAWAATQLIKPVRIGATVLLTPIVARLVRRLRTRVEAAPPG